MPPRVKLRHKAALAGLVVGFISLVSTTAGTFTLLKSFGNLTNITGSGPKSQLVQGPDGALYGTTSEGEGTVKGTVFKIRPDGSGFVVLKWFTDSIEGLSPQAGLALSGNLLYGTTMLGGAFNAGTAFKINTDGSGYKVLKSFAGDASDGGFPVAGLTVSGNTLYGTTSRAGGSGFGWGTVFKLNTDGTGYTVLKEFTEGGDTAQPFGRLELSGDVLYGTAASKAVFKINTDGGGYTLLKHFAVGGLGSGPGAGVTLLDGVLYGTVVRGGVSNLGTVFKLNVDGTGYSVLKEFTGADGSNPRADLIVSAGVLYGTTSEGGNEGVGTVFKVNIDGAGFAVLKHMSASFPNDGLFPAAGLTLVDGALYGTTQNGGGSDGGTVFRMNIDGTGYSMLYDFPGQRNESYPHGGVAPSGSTLYGTTSYGGAANWGTVFRINADGTGYTALKQFPAFPGDGAMVTADMTLSSGVLYGTTYAGGTNGGGGTVFRMNADGTGYAVLKHFNYSYGQGPSGGLTLVSNVLYGTAPTGGSSNAGIVFKLNTDGAGYEELKRFTRSAGDGAFPRAGVKVSGGVIYGTTINGGSADSGTLFRMNMDGTGFVVLKSFDSAGGAWPRGLALSNDVLYGTTDGGGASGSGTVFKIRADGTDYTVLKHFGANSGDGSSPAGLILSGGAIYGTTLFGGSSNSGTVFRIGADGTGYTILKDFRGADGALPNGLRLSNGTLYGTTREGGSVGLGTVFKLELFDPVSLTAQALGGVVVLRWIDPTFSLQAASSLNGAYTTLDGATSPSTNHFSETQKIFRLIKRLGEPE